MFIRMGFEVCKIAGCERRSRDGGYCNAHKYRLDHGMALEIPFRPRNANYKKGTPCSMAECGRPILAHGLCQMHYQREVKGQQLEGPAKKVAGTGRSLTADGYIRITVPRDTPNCRPLPKGNQYGSILEHRHVMQRHLGRPLRPGEQVHHKDGNRTNNAISNLELKASAHGTGITVEDGALAHIAYLETYIGLDLADRAFLERLRDKVHRGLIYSAGKDRLRTLHPPTPPSARVETVRSYVDGV